ncbi:NAD(P)H-binding protein [Thiorhodovibrio frisius]|uniref:Nucleoside-diphosphate-sugar epimerase n=1 Tax=Thiorhodovibrio frisius TaxID=631362 RepID=H8Z2E4_9GAMM|nr:NAD(P)H-binding protein [Thiorhodovibrio frisius]EIC21599.1 nucleoside-diphosphate-sugar epimerase [Thiorhodovibrio frisius]WPL21566.1 hopanoid-associated sugar epimerase [Thiorhodovibrio frisius]
MNILLTGAGGFIGSHLLRALTREGHWVVACVRNLQGAKRSVVVADYIACDFARDLGEEAWLPRLTNIDVIINAVGIIRESCGQRFAALHTDTPIALFRAAAKAGVRKVIQISALGADAGARSQYHLSKRAADEALAGLDIDWTILCPSIVYGAGAKSTALFRALASLPFTPLVGDGNQRIQPLHIDDLVRAVVQAVEDNSTNRQHIELVGPHAITMRELLAKQRQWLDGGELRPLAIPYPLALRLAQLGGFLGATPIDRGSVEMLQRGNCADVTPLIAAFNFRPQSLDAMLQKTPASDADRWHARLYFLAPLLRYSLALLWIFTAITSAFLYPQEKSYALLEEVGIDEIAQPFFLYGAALLDLLLGTALLLRRHVTAVALLQIATILAYSLIITITLPEFWLHPYGPISKNIPLLVATLIMLQLERK